jgi:hypothetical protein
MTPFRGICSVGLLEVLPAVALYEGDRRDRFL